MNNNDIEDDIKILKRIQVTEFNTNNIYDSVEKVNTAIENILADREEWKNNTELFKRLCNKNFNIAQQYKAKANKYDRLVERIKEALDFVKTGKDADSKARASCLKNILKLMEEE